MSDPSSRRRLELWVPVAAAPGRTRPLTVPRTPSRHGLRGGAEEPARRAPHLLLEKLWWDAWTAAATRCCGAGGERLRDGDRGCAQGPGAGQRCDSAAGDPWALCEPRGRRASGVGLGAGAAGPPAKVGWGRGVLKLWEEARTPPFLPCTSPEKGGLWVAPSELSPPTPRSRGAARTPEGEGRQEAPKWGRESQEEKQSCAMGEDGAPVSPETLPQRPWERFRAPAVGGPDWGDGLGAEMGIFPMGWEVPAQISGGPLLPQPASPSGPPAGLHTVTCSPRVEIKADLSRSSTSLSQETWDTAAARTWKGLRDCGTSCAHTSLHPVPLPWGTLQESKKFWLSGAGKDVCVYWGGTGCDSGRSLGMQSREE